VVFGILIMLSKRPCLAAIVVETHTFVGREVVASDNGVLSKELKRGGGRLLANI
jgi:hypothetical protein